MTTWRITRNSLELRIVVYSFHQDAPINLTHHVASVTASRSISKSTEDEMTVSLKTAAAALTVQEGDWIEMSLIDRPMGLTEALWFGQIIDITLATSTIDPSGGTSEVSTIRALFWGSALTRFVQDLRTFMRVNAESLFAPGDGGFTQPEVGVDVGGKTVPFSKAGLAPVATVSLPSLAYIAQGKLFGHSWQAVQLILHYLARYGGTFGQRLWLPQSWTGQRENVPLIELVTLITQTRMPRDEIQRPNWGGADPFDQSLIARLSDLDRGDFAAGAALGAAAGAALGVADVALFGAVAGATLGAATADSSLGRIGITSHWPTSDWYNTFRRQSAYLHSLGMFRDFLQYDLKNNLWELATDYSDPAFTELFCTLLERADFGTLKTTIDIREPLFGSMMSHQRAYIPTIAMRPMPHPTYRDVFGVPQLVHTISGEPMFVADRTNYEKNCHKFAVHAGHLSGSHFRRGLNEIYTYVTVLPQDQELRQLEDFDAAWLLKESGGVLPILDEEHQQHYGYLPLELRTRYYWDRRKLINPFAGQVVTQGDSVTIPNPDGPGTTQYFVEPKPIWQHIGSKILAAYAWSVRAFDRFTGSFDMPIIEANVPRPGDVGYIFEHDSNRRSADASRGPSGRSIIFDQELGDGALSVYVESATYNVAVNAANNVVFGNVAIQYSHGQWVKTPPPRIAPYVRFRDYSEVGIDPFYYLPARPELPALLDEINRTQANIIEVPTVIVDSAKQSRPKKRKRRGKANRRPGLVRKAIPLDSSAIELSGEEIFLELPEEQLIRGRNPAKRASATPAKKQNVLVYDQPGTFITGRNYKINSLGIGLGLLGGNPGFLGGGVPASERAAFIRNQVKIDNRMRNSFTTKGTKSRLKNAGRSNTQADKIKRRGPKK